MRLDHNLNKYLPEFALLNGGIVNVNTLPNEVMRELRRRGKPAHSVANRPCMKKIYDECHMSIVKIGGAYTGKEFLNICEDAKKRKVQVQWLLKEARGGGQGATAWGHIHLHRDNLLEKFFKELNIWEEFSNIPKTKQTNRVQKFLCETEEFPIEPRIKLTNTYPYEGMIFMSQNFADRCATAGRPIPFGAKTAGALKSIIIITPYEFDGYDIAIPNPENKLKLSAEKLAKCMYLNPSIDASKMFSRNLMTAVGDKIGRNPKQGFDLASILGVFPGKDKLELPIKMWHGECTNEVIVDNLFTYTNKSGEKTLTKEGAMILNGADIYSSEILPVFEKGIFNFILKSLQPKIKGTYGIAIPDVIRRSLKGKGEKIDGWLTRYPWSLPIFTTVHIWNDCLCVDEELWAIFGGDYDGDQGAVFEKNSVRGELVWERDRDFIIEHMAPPEKEEDTNNKQSVEEVLATQLDQFSDIGKVYNNCQVIVDAARYQGLSKKKVLEINMTLNSKFVQPKINGVKYKAAIGNVDINSYAKDNYGVEAEHIKYCGRFRGAFRGSMACMNMIIEASQAAKPITRSWYEYLAGYFRHLNPIEEVIKKIKTVVNAEKK